jgi:ATP-dependent Lhr-like helicase
MDAEHAGQIVALMRDGRIKVEAIETVIPTPFALNMIAQGYMDVLRTEERMEFIKRMHQAVLMKIAGK